MSRTLRHTLLGLLIAALTLLPASIAVAGPAHLAWGGEGPSLDRLWVKVWSFVERGAERWLGGWLVDKTGPEPDPDGNQNP